MQSSILQANARVMKWRQIMNGQLLKDKIFLKTKVRKGIPSGLRILIWPILINLNNYKQTCGHDYYKLISQFLLNQPEIRQLVLANFTDDYTAVFKQSVCSVVKSLQLAFPEIKIIKQFILLVGRILQIMNDDTGFYLMAYLIASNIHFISVLKNREYLLIQMHVLTQLLKSQLPNIAKKLEEQELMHLIIKEENVLCLFCNVLQQEVFYRVLDCMMTEGYKIIYRVELTILKMLEKQILENTSEKNQILLKHYNLTKITNNEFIKQLFQFTMTREQIKIYEVAYAKSNRQKIKEIEKESRSDIIKKSKISKQKQEQIAEEGKIFGWVYITQYKKAYPIEPEELLE